MIYEYRSVYREVGTDKWEHLKGYKTTGIYLTKAPCKANITGHKNSGWNRTKLYEYKIERRPVSDWEDDEV